MTLGGISILRGKKVGMQTLCSFYGDVKAQAWLKWREEIQIQEFKTGRVYFTHWAETTNFFLILTLSCFCWLNLTTQLRT